MIFYVYLDPDIFSVAQSEGDYASQALISMIRGLLQNCFILEFEDGRIQSALQEKVNSLPPTFERKILSEFIGIFNKRHRFIYCLTAGCEGNLQQLSLQANELLLDLAILGLEDERYKSFGCAEITTLATYQNSAFESDRSKLAFEGIVLKAGKMEGRELLDRYFRKALKYAAQINIYDNQFGEKYKRNYEYNSRILLQWLEEQLSDPDECVIAFHCGRPGEQARDINDLARDLSGCKTNRLAKCQMSLYLYQRTDSPSHLPHDRFIVTDQIAIGVPRGVDFLDRGTGRNRDLTIDYKGKTDVESLLRDYVKWRQEPIVL
jgi:hypothetical protein